MDTAALLRRALELDRLGQDEAAKAAYVETLQSDPDNIEALTNLGNLAFRTGYRSAARTAYRRAVQIAPGNAVARVNLANALLDADDLAGARAEYDAALSEDLRFAPAHQGLSYVYGRLGDEVRSREHRDLGFSGHPVVHVPYCGSGTPVRVLVVTSAVGGNFNTEWLLDPHVFDVHRLFAEYADPSGPLPNHDVAINAIGDAELCGSGLRAASQIMKRLTVTINSPDEVLRTSRVANAERLRRIPGVIAPRIALVGRAELSGEPEALERRGFAFPLLLRTPGHHTGRHFVKVDSPGGLLEALQSLPGEELLAIEYVDVRDPDGFIRKYRMMVVDGELYPLHAAISRDWKVHYFSAALNQHESFRAEDARFAGDPASVLPPSAIASLRAIAEMLALDYAGIDFSLDSQERLVVFEANATMSVVPADPGDRWSYRKTVIERVIAAFVGMVEQRAACSEAIKPRCK